jgi:hypothetical protein
LVDLLDTGTIGVVDGYVEAGEGRQAISGNPDDEIVILIYYLIRIRIIGGCYGLFARHECHEQYE